MTGKNLLDDADYDGIGLAELVRRREISAAELVEASIQRIEALNPKLNAVVIKTYDAARNGDAELSGPFAGVPFLLKNLGAYAKGIPLTRGSRFLDGFVPDFDTTLVARYRNAGFRILGRTNSPEFGMAATTEPMFHGPTRNPWNLDRSPGGSSGGAAAAVASRMLPIAHANDAGGSMRIPAAFCGLFGLKPSRGRTPQGPKFGNRWRGFVHDHVITRTVRDSAAVLDATHGPGAAAHAYLPPPARPFVDEVYREPEPLRIAFSWAPPIDVPVHPECRKATEAAARLCESLGHHIEEAAPAFDAMEFFRAYVMIASICAAVDMINDEEMVGRKAERGDHEDITRLMCLFGRSLSATDYEHAHQSLWDMVLAVAGMFERYDVLLTPTTAIPPPAIGGGAMKARRAFAERFSDQLDRGMPIDLRPELDALILRSYTTTPFCVQHNVTGFPAMSVPLHWMEDGLPLGVQFTGAMGNEVTLIRLAGQLEQAAPWDRRRPPVS
ncbi:MAG: amidase [Rhodospirillales bacterium]|nr:amidase [Rhodospirillales bacterium]